MKRLWLTIAALALAAGPASAQFNTRGTQSYRNALTSNNEFGSPRFTTTLLPTCAANNLGAMAWDTTTSGFKVCDGSSWAAVGGAAAIDACPQTDAHSICKGDSTLVFEGATANNFETTLTIDDPTADRTTTIPNADTYIPVMAQRLTFAGPTAARTITLPDAAFTVAGLAVTQTFSGVNTFGTAAGAANTWKNVVNGIEFEGATADDFEVTLTVTDPATAAGDTFFYLGPSPDGNPWLGLTAGDSCGSACTDNVFMGSAAGTAANGTSTDNTCVGDASCDLLTSGDNNTFYGSRSGLSVTTGSWNVDVGTRSASFAPAAAQYAVAVGYNTAIWGTLGGVAIGGISETSDGVSIGLNSGNNQGAADVDNVYVGTDSGTAASGTSTDNTCAGDLCLDTLTTGDRVLAMGANTDVGTATDSDATIIGESMVGKGSDTYLDGFGGRERCFTQGTGKALTESTPTAFVRVSVATESYTGAWIRWRVLADDGTDYQSLSGESVIDVVNKAGTETCVIRTIPAFGAATEAASAGTLALEADPACATAAASSVDVSLDAVSSLTQTSLNAFFTICVDGPATVISPQ